MNSRNSNLRIIQLKGPNKPKDLEYYLIELNAIFPTRQENTTAFCFPCKIKLKIWRFNICQYISKHTFLHLLILNKFAGF